MTTINKFFEDLNVQMETLDPYKWLKHIEFEDIPQTIQELAEDIFNIEESVKEYDGCFENTQRFIKSARQTIEYKKECITLLTSQLVGYVNDTLTEMEDDSE